MVMALLKNLPRVTGISKLMELSRTTERVWACQFWFKFVEIWQVVLGEGGIIALTCGCFISRMMFTISLYLLVSHALALD